jgi:hypothetical protein
MCRTSWSSVNLVSSGNMFISGNFSERKIYKNVTFAKNFQGRRTVHNECLLNFVGAGSGFFLWCVYPTCLEFIDGIKFWRKIQRQ